MDYNESLLVSQTISYWLRHNPGDAGLNLDKYGWASTHDVLNALSKSGIQISSQDLIELNNSFSKKRWEFESTFIRAKYGHSIPVINRSFDFEPPELLYHGTSIDNVSKIINDGLLPMSRNSIHLSDSFELAEKVGRRHGFPIVIELCSEELIDNDIIPTFAGDGVWLAESIPNPLFSLTPWHPESDEAIKTGVLEELKKEVSPIHKLYNKVDNLELIWRSQTCDDELFIDKETNECYMIHLTWQGTGTMEGYPGFNAYKSIDEWVKDGFLRDYKNFYDLN